MTCLIRQADVEDLPVLPLIERAAGQLFAGIPELAFVADHEILTIRDHMMFLKTGVLFVAQSLEGPNAGDVVGFICGRTSGKTIHIYEMSVAPDSQGRGIGATLMAAMLDDAVANRCDAATLTTFRDVAWNDAFYRKLGFTTVTDADLDPRLKDILAQEVKAGLPADRRCAMRLSLK
jgi:ribosomal protein S18 acetylase RimI-like enzyme